MGIGSPERLRRTCVAAAIVFTAFAAPAHAGDLLPVSSPSAGAPAPVVESVAPPPAPAVVAPPLPASGDASGVTPPPAASVPEPPPLPSPAPALQIANTVVAAHAGAPVTAGLSTPHAARPAPPSPARRHVGGAHPTGAVSPAAKSLPLGADSHPGAARLDEARSAPPDRAPASIVADRGLEAPPSPALPGRAPADCPGPPACGGSAGSGGGFGPLTALILTSFVFGASVLARRFVPAVGTPRSFASVLLLERPG
jgi:hypothetical protein